MSFDRAALRALAAERSGVIGPCNRRCDSRGRCAFGRADTAGRWCRERRPPRREEVLLIPAEQPGGS